MLAVAERLLTYAAASRWPMVNRVSAIEGLRPLLLKLGDPAWLDQLRMLARPTVDLDEMTHPHLREMWSTRGELEAAALHVCATISPDPPPAWLDEAVTEARFDDRAPLRETSWRAASLRSGWFEPHSARHALRDPDPTVQVAALEAWQRTERPPPDAELLRLVEEPNWGIRLAAIQVLRQSPQHPAAAVLRHDPDAYVRRITQRELLKPKQ
jgi:hypothetical protein